MHVQPGHTTRFANLVFATLHNALRKQCAQVLTHLHPVLLHMLLQVIGVFFHKALQFANTALLTVVSVYALLAPALGTL